MRQNCHIPQCSPRSLRDIYVTKNKYPNGGAENYNPLVPKQTARNTMKHENMKKITLALALGLPVLAIAGPETPQSIMPKSNPGDWCEWYGNKPGILYKNKENPYIQEFQIEGRLQYQFAHVDGEDKLGKDYNENFDEVRRARLGVKAKFLQYFGMKYQVNLAEDGRPSGGDLKWGYQDIDEAYLSFNLGKAMGNSGFDELSLVYGRQKFVFGTESHTSSTKLLTIERSALANKVYGSFRPTGLTLEGAKGPLTFNASLYSTTTDGDANKEFNGWNDSYSVLLGAGYQVSDELLVRSDFTYNGAEPTNENSVMNYQWALGFGAEYDAGAWGMNSDVIYGDNGNADYQSKSDRQGSFYGFQVTPYYWLVDKKLQFVAQYQYQGSDGSEGVRINSRYGRRDSGTLTLNDGRGNSHQSLYSGLNYYLCGHSAKVQVGVEYQAWNAPTDDFNTLTYLVGFRTYF